MARPDLLWVFAYDVVRDGPRERLADLLSAHLTRVQDSVFEGRLSVVAAERLARDADRFLGPDDSLRCYCVTEAGRRASIVLGPRPLAEAGDFWLV